MLSDIRLEDVTLTVDRIPVWKLLPEDVKRRFIEKRAPEELFRILTSPELRELFKDELKQIIRRLLKDGAPSHKTYIVYNYMLNRILPDDRLKAELVKYGHRYYINAGLFYIQVNNVEKDKVEFIMYRKDIRWGVIYEGKNLYDALMKALKTYDEIIEKYPRPMKKGIFSILNDRYGNPIKANTETEGEAEHALA